MNVDIPNESGPESHKPCRGGLAVTISQSVSNTDEHISEGAALVAVDGSSWCVDGPLRES